MGLDPIIAEANRRHESHIGHPSHRPLSPNYELKGLRGEEALIARFGGAVDLTPRANGDGGFDSIIHTTLGSFKVDVKCAEKPYNLIVEVGKVKPLTIYVLAQYHPGNDSAVLLGWEWAAKVLAAPTREFGHGVMNHYIRRGRLRDLGEIDAVRLT